MTGVVDFSAAVLELGFAVAALWVAGLVEATFAFDGRGLVVNAPRLSSLGGGNGSLLALRYKYSTLSRAQGVLRKNFKVDFTLGLSLKH